MISTSVCDPIHALLDAPTDAVLAVIAGVSGPSYRPVGAMMVVIDETERSGSLSSGCIEKDISLQALRVRETKRPEIVRYGQGSRYIDIQLPCGGGLDVLLLPLPDKQVLADVAQRHGARRACTLSIDVEDGKMLLADTGATGRTDGRLFVRIEPDIAFQVFGKGPEASIFAALAQSAGYPSVLLSPDTETLDAAAEAGCATHHLTGASYPEEFETDYRTAVVLFFHDHDWEPPILAAALDSPAFYVGAQGSRQACNARLSALESMGVPAMSRARLRGPIGLIPSARDAGTLAVSVLAEVLATAMMGDS